MMKRLTACVLCILLIVGMLPASAMAFPVVDDWDCVIDEETGTATITRYKGNAETLTFGDFPTIAEKEAVSYPVTAIASSAFSGKSTLKIVSIPSEIQKIGSGAFSGCSGLTAVRIKDLEAWCRIDFGNAAANPLSAGSVSLQLLKPRENPEDADYQVIKTLPDETLSNVSSIGNYAFAGYKHLTGVTLPDSVTAIGDGAFTGCTALEEVKFPSHLKGIGDSAFSGCTKLTEAALPSGTERIGKSAFSGCTALRSLSIPSTVTVIDSSAFSGCKKMKVYLEDLTSWCDISFPNAASNPLAGADELYVRGMTVTNLVLPMGITAVNNYAFCGFQSLKCVILPEGVKYLNPAAFLNCRSLEYALIPKSVESIAQDSFSGCTSLTDVYFTGSEDKWDTLDPSGEKVPAEATVHCDTPKYVVTFTADNGEEQGFQTAALGDRDYTLPACAFDAPLGKRFGAWVIGYDEFAEGTVFSPQQPYAVWREADKSYHVSVTARWATINHTISFDPGDGTGAMASRTVAYGTSYTLPECTFKAPEGKVFDGWKIGYRYYDSGDSFTPEADVTAVAQWTTAPCTITFAPGEGTGEMEPDTAYYGQPHTLTKCTFEAPDDPDDEHEQMFKAWQIGNSEETIPDKGEYTPTGDITLTALYAQRLTVSFDTNGGTGSIADRFVAKGNQVKLPYVKQPDDEQPDAELPDNTFIVKAPEKKGFKAWQIGEDTYKKPGESITVDEDLIVKAVWAELYTVSYDANGGSGTMESSTVLAGNSISLPDCTFEKPEGKSDFKFWQLGEDTENPYKPGKTYTPTADTVFKAVWGDMFTLHFEPGGGGKMMEDASYGEGKTAVLPECGFTPPQPETPEARELGFKAWKIGEEEHPIGYEFPMTGDTTATAVWSEMCTITYHAGDGTGEDRAVNPRPNGTDITLLKVEDCGFEAPEGKEFSAWEINGEPYYPGARYTLSADTEITAVWSDKCKVTYRAGDGTGDDYILPLLPNGTPITLLTIEDCGFGAPEAKGFLAWDIYGEQYAPDASYTIYGDTEITAVWINLYNVFFDANGGSGSMSAQAILDGSALTLPSCEFQPPAGCVFEAWMIDGKEYPIGASYKPDKDTKITAVWNSDYECTSSNGETTVKRYKGTDPIPSIPTLLGGFPVTGIGDGAFSGCVSMTRIVIPEGVRTIGKNAFSGCNKMVRVYIPSSLTSVGTNAFTGCAALTGMYVTDLAALCAVSFENVAANPLSIAENLFLNEKQVTELVIPAGVTRIGSYVFYNCTKIESLDTAASGLTEIGSYAFSGCTGLREIKAFPAGMTSIGERAFSGCTALLEIKSLPVGMTSIGESAFFGCSKLEKVALPDGLTTVSANTFSGCTGLQDVTIPRSVTKMEEGAFYGCKIGKVRISDLASWCRIDFAKEYSNPLNNAASLYVRGTPVTDLTIQDEISSVSNYAFYGFQGLKCVIIPENVTIIYQAAFKNCANLEYVLIPVGMESLAADAFASCRKMTDVYYTGSKERWTEETPNYEQFLSDKITIHYNAKQVTVTLHPGEGTGTPEQTSAIVARPYVLTEPPFTAPEGKHFKAWKIGNQEYLWGQSFTPEDEGEITITALWGDITHPIHFEANGGTGEMQPLSVNDGKSFELPPCGFNPPKVGEQFKAWQINDQEYTPGSAFTPTGETTVTALWVPLICEISFDAAGGTETQDTICTTYNTAVALPACTFVPPEGKTFKAWSLDGRERQPGYSFKPTESLTVRAVWQDIKCEITFDANGGGGSMSEKPVVYGTKYTLPPCKFSAPFGQAFRAWEIDGTEYAVGAEVIVKKDTAVKAVWAPITYTITFDPCYGDVTEQIVNDGAELRLPQYTQTVPDLTFKAWMYEGEEYLPDAVVTPTGDMTFTAVWDGEYRFTISAGKTTLTGYNGSKTELVIPGKLGGCPVTAIGSSAFAQSNLTAVTIPASVASIGSNAFSGCTALEGVYITDLTAWCGITFENAAGNPLSAAKKLYLNGTLVESLSFPEGAAPTSIGDYAFINCTGMREAVLPTGLARIGASAFSGCSALTAVTIPASVTEIRSNAFQDCKVLSSVSITDLAAWCGIAFENGFANPLYHARTLSLRGEPVTELTVPDNAAVIRSYAFYHFRGLRSVTIPQKSTAVQDDAFSSCRNLETILIPEGMEALGDAFKSSDGLRDVYFTGTEDQWQALANHQQFERDGVTIHCLTKLVSITFAANNGSGDTDKAYVISGTPYALPECAYAAPEKKAFKAWKLGDAEYAAGDTIMPAQDVTVTALWADFLTASVQDQRLSYQIYIPIPDGARLIAAGYDKTGRQLWTLTENSPRSSGTLTVQSAERCKLFLVQGESLKPLCASWDSGAKN